jgi:hypothetical protein
VNPWRFTALTMFDDTVEQRALVLVYLVVVVVVVVVIVIGVLKP